jgi:hypothetical protein
MKYKLWFCHHHTTTKMTVTVTLTMMTPLVMMTTIMTYDNSQSEEFLDVSNPHPNSSSQLQEYRRNNTQIQTLKF